VTPLLFHEIVIVLSKGFPYVTGAPYREVNSKVATAPKLKVEDKDKSKIHEESKRLNLISLSCRLHSISSLEEKLVIEVECQTLKLK